jgi:hypothetical protein
MALAKQPQHPLALARKEELLARQGTLTARLEGNASSATSFR